MAQWVAARCFFLSDVIGVGMWGSIVCTSEVAKPLRP